MQLEVLEAIAVGKPLAEAMDTLCRRVEAQAPGLICTVVRIDDLGVMHPLASPSLPPSFNESLEGVQIGPSVGSCGTAAFRGEPVDVADIATDPLWTGYRDMALPYGLAACWSSPVKDRNGRVAATFAMYYREPRKASEFHRAMVDACVHLVSVAIQHDEARSTIDRLAFYDQLTGLPNRVLLADRADVALAMARDTNEPVALLCIDVDRFKTVNDSLGYTGGNRVLQEVARRLRSAVTNGDTVCRLGGDDFAMLMHGVDGAQAADLADRLRGMFSQPFTIEGYTFSSSASIGISLFPEDANSFDGLLKNAEAAVHQAKESGRNCIRFFKDEMDEAATDRLELENAIRQAVRNRELTLAFQPQISLATQEVTGVEALVRWEHPRWGEMAPDRFIPLAEECGLVNDIDAWVLEEACRQLAAWDELGVDIPTIAVNVSATDFQHGEMPRRLTALLARYGLSGERIVVEITESLVLEHSEKTQRAFTALRAAGVRVSVDDFGTGYSSLSYLNRFPVDELKLDRSFVRDLERGRRDREIATAVIRVGQSLGLSVVAEGVETEAQLEFLRKAGCHVGQGFYFSEPLVADALATWIEAR